jgi:hypothetical protein
MEQTSDSSGFSGEGVKADRDQKHNPAAAWRTTAKAQDEGEEHAIILRRKIDFFAQISLDG